MDVWDFADENPRFVCGPPGGGPRYGPAGIAADRAAVPAVLFGPFFPGSPASLVPFVSEPKKIRVYAKGVGGPVDRAAQSFF